MQKVNIRSRSVRLLRLFRGKRAFYPLGTLGALGSILLLQLNNEYDFMSSSNTKQNTIHIENAKRVKSFTDSINQHLANKPPHYIEASNIEQLISLPRYQHVLFLIKQAKRYPSKLNNQKVIEELFKLSNLHHETNDDSFNKATINLNNSKNSFTINKTEMTETTNPFLNNGIANNISQQLNKQLMFEMAFKSPEIDNRFFSNELPNIVHTLNKTCPGDCSVKGGAKNPVSIYEDIDYALILEFHKKFSHILLDNKHPIYGKNKNINLLLNKLRKELNALIISEYAITNRPKHSIWSTDDSDISYADYDEALTDDKIHENTEKALNLKEKIKWEFIERNEALIMNLIELMAKIDIDEFVNLMGMEFLLILFEKHKYQESYLTSIGNCLCLISLNSKYHDFFIYTGWLKRLNQMCNSKKFGMKSPDEIESGSINLVREVIAHKILSNLVISSEDKAATKYSTTIFPLYPMYGKQAVNSAENTHQHTTDIVFIHGLRGSLFRTWRQNRAEDYPTLSVTEKTPSDLIISENKLLDKLNNFIDIQLNEKYTFCWPKDWLVHDLHSNGKSSKELENIRIFGVSYQSFFSEWQEILVQDKNPQSSIKKRAIDLIDQLELANIGQRPTIWITHSMGGIIVKQMLVYLKELEMKNKNIGNRNNPNNLLENTKGIIFLSSPHLGSHVAKNALNFNFALYASNEVGELASDSKYLLDLNKNFLNLIKNSKIEILSICEKLATYFGFNLYAITVTEASANLGVGEFYVANNKDHLNVCKPDNKKCVVYNKEIDFINKIIENENKNCKICELKQTVNGVFDLNEKSYLFFSNFSNF